MNIHMDKIIREKDSSSLIRIKKTKIKKGDVQSKEVAVIEDRYRNNAFNTFKHGKRADLPAWCNVCRYGKNPEVGGTGQCTEYKEDSICTVRADFAKFYSQFNTRKIEDVKTIIDIQVKSMGELLSYVDFIGKMEGNLPDKQHVTILNSFMRLLTMQTDMMQQTTAMQVKQKDEEGKDLITQMFQAKVTG